jgi:large subunit ribosomal protein L9
VKIILKQDVKGVGKAGAIADVADGYGRNYLLPRGFAEEATAGNLAQAATRKAAQTKRDEKAMADARDVAAKLEARAVVIRAKGGEGGRLFGAVTNAQIAEGIESTFGVTLDRHIIALEEPIKTAGDHTCEVKLAHGVVAHVKVTVEPEV